MAPSESRNASAQRGTKRKRTTSKRPAVKQETPGEIISKKLHHGLHEARKAAKKAAAFELRKLVKRLKQARAQDAGGKPVKGDDPAEMERQLEVLKHAEHEQFANTALRTKILKDKLLSQNDDVQAALAEKLATNLVAPQEPGSSAAKVHARLLSSKILADAVHAVVDTLREVLDPSLAKGKAKAAADEESTDEEEEDEMEVEQPSRGKKARVAEESDEEDDEEGSEAEVDDAGWESGTVDGGDDAGWESGTVDGGDGAVVGSSDEDEEEQDDDESADESADEPPKSTTKPAAKDAKSKSKATGGESTFLPSLSVGFTRGDSDASDISDNEADAPRKNRRGQRARRAIWEKKYGKNANHVKKQQEQDPRQQRRDGARGGGGGGGGNSKGPGKSQWQARGAPSRHGAQKPFVAPQRTDSGWGKPVGAGAGANSKTGGQKEEKALHPSWEAKRKLKEKLNPGIVPAQGKKIKFS